MSGRLLTIDEVRRLYRARHKRHTAVSYMMMNGIDLKTIAELVGHTTAEMVDKRYGHLSPDHKRTATGVFGAAMDKAVRLRRKRSRGRRGQGGRSLGSGHFLDTFAGAAQSRGINGLGIG